jgi:hypothetical protein
MLEDLAAEDARLRRQRIGVAVDEQVGPGLRVDAGLARMQAVEGGNVAGDEGIVGRRARRERVQRAGLLAQTQPRVMWSLRQYAAGLSDCKLARARVRPPSAARPGGHADTYASV